MPNVRRTWAEGGDQGGGRVGVRRIRRRPVTGVVAFGVSAGPGRRAGRGPAADGPDEGVVRLEADRGSRGVRPKNHGHDVGVVVAPAVDSGDADRSTRGA